MGLLSQQRTATVRAAQQVELHGDRYVDLAVVFVEPPGSEATGRLPLSSCPADLKPGESVSVRLVLNVMVEVKRA